MNLVFLVYDSRSGSTLLSREISAYFDSVLVTPELRFDPLLRLGEPWMQRAGVSGVGEILKRYRFSEKTGLAHLEIEAAIAARKSLSIESVIEEICLRLAQRAGRPEPTTTIVKSGAHLWEWRRIRACLPEARFLFVVRDPRAVIQSKLRTERPYHAGQSMAWAGCAAAALQWRWYAKTAQRIAAQGVLLEVAYEQLLADPFALMRRIGAFIGDSSAGRGESSYRIPQAEQAIHQLVLEEGLATERADAWREQLGARDRAVIEQICATEMRRRGYEAVSEHGKVARLALVAQELLRSGGRIGGEMLARGIQKLPRARR